MNRYRRPASLAMVAAMLLLTLPWATAAAAAPSGGVKVAGERSETIDELATLTVTLPANVAAFDGRVLTAPGAAEVVGVAPVGGGIGLRPEASGDGTAIGAYGLRATGGVTKVLVAVNPLVAGRVKFRVVIDSAADADGRRVSLGRTTAVGTIAVGEGTRLLAAPVPAKLLKPTSKAVKPRDLRLDRRFNVQDVDTARAAWSRAHAAVGSICGGAPEGDANGDGCTDAVDLQLLHSMQGDQATATTSSTPMSAEPDRSVAVGTLAAPVAETDAAAASPTSSRSGRSRSPARPTPPTRRPATASARTPTAAARCAPPSTEADYMQGDDRIAFNLPGTAPVTIQLASGCRSSPPASGGVFIDGYSQPGASLNTADVRLERRARRRPARQRQRGARVRLVHHQRRQHHPRPR